MTITCVALWLWGRGVGCLRSLHNVYTNGLRLMVMTRWEAEVTL